jgi:hypothetical protein
MFDQDAFRHLDHRPGRIHAGLFRLAEEEVAEAAFLQLQRTDVDRHGDL